MLTQDLINLKSLDDSINSSVSVSELLMAYGECVPIGEEKCYWSIGKAGFKQLQTSFQHLPSKLDWLQTLYLISSADGGVVSIGVRSLF
ncbi:MAG TPA: hypothetical protein DE179_04185 [Oceanospirillaceae bacterium]|nr:hypothetical protein [Oceanospirillaceae bacterium]